MKNRKPDIMKVKALIQYETFYFQIKTCMPYVCITSILIMP